MIPESSVKKKSYKWINIAIESEKEKTCEWWVYAKDGGYLGSIKWWPGWRCYCFFPANATLFEEDCLRNIAEFCQQVTTMHKAGPMRLAEAAT